MSFSSSHRYRLFQTALLSLIAFGAGRVFAADGDPALKTFENDIQPVLDQYCYDCHGNGSSKGGVQLDGFESDAALKDHKLWMRALNNVRTHLMPPAGKPPLPPGDAAKLAAWIKRDAFGLDPAQPDPGRVTVRRLNRVEYRNTVLAITGIDYDTQTEFPADDTGHGFDNIGDVLTISPMLMEKYLDAAQAVISKAVPSESRVLAEATIEGRSFVATSLPPEAVEINPEEEAAKPAAGAKDAPKPTLRPKPIAEGNSLDLSYYTPAIVAKTFEATQAGKYELIFNLKAVEHYVDDQFDYNRCKLIIKSDGETLREQEFVREGDQAISYTLARDWPAGPHQITVEIQPLGPEKPQVRMLRLRLKDVDVRGPFEKKYWVKPKNYARFFPMDPPKGATKRSRYAKEIISRFATRAYRRPVDAQTVSRLAEIAVKVASEPGSTFEAGVAQAMVAVLASPRFIFREEESEPLQPGQMYPLVDEYALASRMSYFLWSSMPDDELFRLAGAHQLRANLSAQIDRMLKDRRSLEFVRNFSGQWLQARDIASVPINSFEIYLREHPDPAFDRAKITFQSVVPIPENKRTPEQVAAFTEARNVFFGLRRRSVPDLSDKVRDAMLKETQLYFGYVIQEDRSLTELIDSHYTFLNETLAKHYGVEGVVGKEMRRVELPADSPRGGILTQGTVLAVTSNPTRTSPVKRGVFILEAILGTPPAPPPPNIPALEDAVSRSQLKKMSLRETMAVHASNKLCASCHSRMDPLGLALENFNAMGRWRESELDQPINPAGKLITGESFTDIRDLKRILATSHREDFYYAFSEKLLTYGLGRGVEYYDTDTLDQLVAKLDGSGGRPSALIRGIIESVPFQQRRIEPPVNLKAAAVAAGESSNRLSQNAP